MDGKPPMAPELVKLALSNPQACAATLAQVAWLHGSCAILDALRANVELPDCAERDQQIERILTA